jgi:hypothetical protein
MFISVIVTAPHNHVKKGVNQETAIRLTEEYHFQLNTDMNLSLIF